jgi:hypothetical protein
LVLGFLLSLFFLFGWFDHSEMVETALQNPTRVTVVATSGPIEIVGGDQAIVAVRNSWLFSEPTIEIVERNGEAVVRASCPGRFPCRSAVRLTLPAGVDVTAVASDGVVDVSRFDGHLEVFSTAEEGVLLSSVVGTARIVSSSGAIVGAGLQLSDLSVETVDARVELGFGVPPDNVSVEAGSELVVVTLPDRLYRVEIETVSLNVEVAVDEAPASARSIAVSTTGPVRVGTART